MNKNGWTLIELLLTITLIGLLMTIAIPSITSYLKKIDEEKYLSYEKMMKEYAIASEIEKVRIDLSELDGLETIKEECIGYVLKSDNDYQAFISCSDKYETKDYQKNA